MWRLATAAVLLWTLASLFGWPARINHDVAMYVYMGDRLVHGAIPYVDIIDLNPPLIIYLSAVPATVGRLLGVGLPLTMLVMTWGFAAWSIGTSHRLLERVFPQSSLPGITALGLSLMTVVLVVRNDFGQKEHLFAIALVPFLLLRSARTSNDHPAAQWSAAIIGCVAGVIACLKPHFLVIALAPELFWLLRRRGLRELRSPELVFFGAVGLAYALHFLLIPQEMRAAFFERWIPFVADGYHAYNQPLGFIARRWTLWAPLVAAGAVAIAGRRVTGGRELGPVLAISTAGAIGMMLLQHKGWTHHAYPAYVLLCVALAVMTASVVDAVVVRTRDVAMRRARPFAVVILSLLIAAATLASIGLAIRPALNPFGAPVGDPLVQVVEAHSAPGDPVLILSTAMGPTFPMLLQLDRRQASRFMFAFPLPMIYAGTSWRAGDEFPYRLPPGSRADAEALYRAELQTDIRTHRPKVIAVDTRCHACPDGLALPDYLQATGVLSGAMAGYRELAPVAGVRVFVEARSPRP